MSPRIVIAAVCGLGLTVGCFGDLPAPTGAGGTSGQGTGSTFGQGGSVAGTGATSGRGGSGGAATGGSSSEGGSGNVGNQGGSGNAGNQGGSGNAGNQGGSGNAGNQGGSGNVGNQGGSGNVGNQGGSGNTGNQGGSGNAGGQSGATVNCGNDACELPGAYCCITHQFLQVKFECRQAAMPCQGTFPHRAPATCDDRTDCEAGTGCCGTLDGIALTDRYSKIECAASCGDTDEVVMCDPNDSQACAPGLTCGPSALVSGFHHCE